MSSTNNQHTLSAEAVSAGYHPRFPVLHGVSLHVKRGEVTALIGPNGSGKSTLLRVLGGALKPSAGTAAVDEQNVYRTSARDLARQIAFVPQDNPAPFAFTVQELVELGANAGVSDTENKKTGNAHGGVQAALAVFDLGDFARRSLTNLSGGERQRAALARAWAQNTPFLLLDEPTAHLDLRHQSLLLGAVRRAAGEENRGVLLVLHDLNLAGACADTVFLLNKGHIAASGAAGEVLQAAVLEPVYQTALHVKQEGGAFWVRGA